MTICFNPYLLQLEANIHIKQITIAWFIICNQFEISF